MIHFWDFQCRETRVWVLIHQIDNHVTIPSQFSYTFDPHSNFSKFALLEQMSQNCEFELVGSHVIKNWIKIAYSKSLKSRDHKFWKEIEWSKTSTAYLGLHVITSFTYLSGPKIIPPSSVHTVYIHCIHCISSRITQFKNKN